MRSSAAVELALATGIAVVGGACKFDELPPLSPDGAVVAACDDQGADSPDPSCPADHPICVDGACGGVCASDADCAGRPAPEATCHTGSGECVACDEDDRQAEPGSGEDECASPSNSVCDGSTRTCRPCQAHAECYSGVCDSGTCVDPARVIYLSSTGADTGACATPATGCATLAFAIGKLTAQRRFILFLPSQTPYQSVLGTGDARLYLVDAHIIGYGATLTRAENREIVRADQSTVVVEGLTISGGSIGFQCSGGAVTLRGVEVQYATGLGVFGECDLTITNSRIFHNRGGGVHASSIARMSNNWIAGNGEAGGTTAGIRLSTVSTQTYVEFNTVVNNRADPQFADGIHCDGPSGMTLRNNIVIGLKGQRHLATNSNCAHAYTLVAPDNLVAGVGNLIVSDLASFKFVDQGTFDFHLSPTSIAVGKADASMLRATQLFDFDGDARVPNGTSVEVGADEIP